MHGRPSNPPMDLDAFAEQVHHAGGPDHVPVACRAPAVLDTALELAEARLNQDVPEGLAAVELVRAVTERHGDDARRAIARRVHARGLAMSNRFDEAIEAAADAVRAARAAGSPVLAGRAHMVELHALARLGRSAEAIEAGLAAHAVFVDAGESVLAAKCDANLGETHRLAGDPASALACFDRAREVLGAGTPMVAPLETNRGQALLDLNRFQEAEESFRQAAAAFEAGGNRVGMAIVEGNLGDLLSREGRIDAALRHFEQACRFFERSGAQGDLARLTAEQAELMMVRGATEDAIAAYRSALPALRDCGLRAEAARAATGLARALVRRRRFDEAAAAIDESRLIHAAMDHPAGRAAVELAAGELDLATGRPDVAARRLVRVVEACDGRPVEAARARLALATAEARCGRPVEAAGTLETAIADASAHGIRPLMAELLHARGLLRRDRGDVAAAREDFRAAIGEIEAIRGSLQAERFRAAFLGDRSAVHDALVELLVAEGTPAAIEEAFDISGRARGRTLLELVRQRGAAEDEAAAGGPVDALGPQIDRHLQTLDALYSRVTELPTMERAPEALADWRREVRRVELAIEHLEGRRDATATATASEAADGRLRAGRGITGRLGPAEIRTRLAPGSVMVVYHTLPGCTIAFVLDHHHLRAVRLEDGTADLEDLAGAIMFQVQRGLSWAEEQRGDPRLVADAAHELGRLHQRLLAPLGPAVAEADELIIVPHGPLHGVPFHAAHDGRRYLLERCAVRTLPAASLLGPRLEHAAAPVRRRAVVIGAADEDAPGIPAEIEAVAAALGSSVDRADADATRARFLADAPGATLLHVASHGRFSDLGPDSSGLRMRDGWITVREIRRLPLDGAAVVLSGCDTGRAVVSAGDELAGLDRGFLSAGARGLVRSLWPLHDATARDLMAEAYRHWMSEADGGGARTTAGGLFDAIRRSQVAMLERHPHPCLWAALACVGDG